MRTSPSSPQKTKSHPHKSRSFAPPSPHQSTCRAILVSASMESGRRSNGTNDTTFRTGRGFSHSTSFFPRRQQRAGQPDRGGSRQGGMEAGLRILLWGPLAGEAYHSIFLTPSQVAICCSRNAVTYPSFLQDRHCRQAEQGMAKRPRRAFLQCRTEQYLQRAPPSG